jgi:hypothetical protein
MVLELTVTNVYATRICQRRIGQCNNFEKELVDVCLVRHVQCIENKRVLTESFLCVFISVVAGASFFDSTIGWVCFVGALLGFLIGAPWPYGPSPLKVYGQARIPRLSPNWWSSVQVSHFGIAEASVSKFASLPTVVALPAHVVEETVSSSDWKHFRMMRNSVINVSFVATDVVDFYVALGDENFQHWRDSDSFVSVVHLKVLQGTYAYTVQETDEDVYFIFATSSRTPARWNCTTVFTLNAFGYDTSVIREYTCATDSCTLALEAFSDNVVIVDCLYPIHSCGLDYERTARAAVYPSIAAAVCISLVGWDVFRLLTVV